MRIRNVQGISNAIGNINKDHMTKKTHVENAEFVVMRMTGCFVITHNNYSERKLCNQQNFLYYNCIFFSYIKDVFFCRIYDVSYAGSGSC